MAGSPHQGRLQEFPCGLLDPGPRASTDCGQRRQGGRTPASHYLRADHAGAAAEEPRPQGRLASRKNAAALLQPRQYAPDRNRLPSLHGPAQARRDIRSGEHHNQQGPGSPELGQDALLPIPEPLSEGRPEHILKKAAAPRKGAARREQGGRARPGPANCKDAGEEIIPHDNDKSIKFGILRI